MIELLLADIQEVYFVTTAFYNTEFQDIFKLTEHLTSKDIKWFIYKDDKVAINVDDWLCQANRLDWMPGNFIFLTSTKTYYVTPEVNLLDDILSDIWYLDIEGYKEQFPRVFFKDDGFGDYWFLHHTGIDSGGKAEYYFVDGYSDYNQIRERYSFTCLGILSMLYKMCPNFLKSKCYNVILAHSPIIPEQFKIYFRGGCNEFVI